MITFSLDSQSKDPLYQQIYNYIRNEIMSGSLSAGDKLPSSRSLSMHLEVSRTTIDLAYNQLASEGYIDSRPKSGYYVNSLSNLKIIQKSSSVPSKKKMVKSQIKYPFDFSPDNVDMDSFPHSVWRRLSKECMQDTSLFSLGDSQGDESFRIAIASYLHSSRGVNCSPDQIIVGAGVDYLLSLLTSILNSEKKIAMENPAYQRARKIFSEHDFSIVDVPVNENGMSLESLESSDATYCYVTPSHQFPLGSIMPISNRQKLLSWAQKDENRYIIEDDHDSEFRYRGKPIPSLQGLDSYDKVIYIGTFSKAIAPAIRIGYMVLPQNLYEIYLEKCSYLACTVSRIDQALLASFIEKGYFEKHLNRMRKIYKSRHDLALHILSKCNVTIKGENAGLYLVIYLNNKKGRIAEEELISQAKSYQIKLYGLYEYFSKPSENDYQPGFLLGFGSLTEEQLKEGLTLLCEQVLS